MPLRLHRLCAAVKARLRPLGSPPVFLHRPPTASSGLHRRCSSAPDNSTAADKEVAATAFLTPDRRLQSHGSGGIARHPPTGPSVREKVEVYGLTATARTLHGCAPKMVAFAYQIQRPPAQTLRQFFNLDRAVQSRPGKPRAEPVPETLDPDQHTRLRSVSSGISNSGDVSPRPTCATSDPCSADSGS